MRRESAEVAAAAERRLELLGREMGRGTDRRAGPDPEVLDDAVPVRMVVVDEPGRHARSGRPSWTERLREGVEERVPDSVRGRFTLRPAHLGLVALVVATVLSVVAWTVLRSAPSETPVPVAHTSRPAVTPGSPAPGPSAAPSATAVVVDVAGKVLRPGVETLPAGARVIDAIKRAGGARPGVDLSGLNLARTLVDGEQVLVGLPAGPGGGPPGGPPAAAAAAGGSGAKVDLNTATLEQLEGLPGVGPVTAQKILAWRTAHGSFSSADELLEVDGIGDKTLAEIAPHVSW